MLVLLLVSITLATGLSWFAVMERIGTWVLALGPLMQRKTHQATEWQQTRVMREEREEVRKVDAVKQAKREPVRIEPPPAPVVEKSERAKRDTQIPMFQGVSTDGSDLPPLALLDDPKPQARAIRKRRWRRCRGRSSSSSRISASRRRWSGPIRVR